MRKIFIIILVISCKLTFSQSTVKVNEYNVYLNGKISPTLTLTTASKLNEKWSFNTYFYASKKWGEGLAGFSYKLTNWFELGYIGGFETGSKLNNTENMIVLRGSPIFGIKKGNYSAVGFFEHGGDFPRWKLKGFYNFEHVRYGFEGVRSGDLWAIGPRSEVYFFDKLITIWGSVLYVYSEKGTYDPIAGQLGFLFTFK